MTTDLDRHRAEQCVWSVRQRQWRARLYERMRPGERIDCNCDRCWLERNEPRAVEARQ